MEDRWHLLGTVLVKDIASGSKNSYPYELTPYGRQLLFWTFGSRGSDLWKSDGSGPGTVKVTGLVNDSYDWPEPQNSTVVGSTVFFSSCANKLGFELWKTDGTKTGTVLVKDIFPGKDSDGYANNSYPEQLTGVGSTLFFLADSSTGDSELWSSDGTSLGTQKVSGGFSNAADLTAVGTTLYFAATSSSGDRELWKVDNPSQGAALVANINPNGSSDPSALKTVGTQLYFGANNGSNGKELMSYDPSTQTVQLVEDIHVNSDPNANPDPNLSSSPSNLTISGTTLYFNASDSSGRGLWSLPVAALSTYNPPRVTAARVSGNSLILSLNQKVEGKGGSIDAANFKVLVGGVAVAATAASLDGAGTTLTLTLASSPASTAITDVFYCPPAGAGVGSGTLLGVGGTPMDPQTINAQTTAGTFLSSVSVSGLASTYSTLLLQGLNPINGSGNADANTIVGNAAANTLAGKLGNDLLTGQAGADNFLFDTTPNSTSNRDTITDFSRGSDRIVLSRTIFKALGNASTLSSSQLVVYSALSPLVPTAGMRLLFNSDTSVLAYDSDGSGSNAAVEVALLSGIGTLSTGDFTLVR